MFHNAAEGVGPIDRGSGPKSTSNPFDILQLDRENRRCGGPSGIIDPHAVDQNQYTAKKRIREPKYPFGVPNGARERRSTEVVIAEQSAIDCTGRLRIFFPA